MTFYRTLERPFLDPENGMYCLLVQGSKDEKVMENFDVYFDTFDEACAVWKSFIDRFEFHTTESLDKVVTDYRDSLEVNKEDN